MGRRGGGGGGGRRSYSSGKPKFRSLFRKKSDDDEKKKAPPPAKVETTHGETRTGSFFQSMTDGFGFGMGHRFVEAIFGPRTIRQEIVVPEKVEVAAASSTAKDNEKYKDYTQSCSISYDAFQECLNVEGNNLRKCHMFMDALFECRRNSSSYNF